jgi:NADH-quinone oxidoreductase subunit A
MIDMTGHFIVFTVVAVGFLLAPLLLGKLVRPKLPTAEKDAVYECGEPTIGSSYIQFDLRFYVVALLFIVFDVEVAFFFPWATVFGSAVQLSDPGLTEAARTEISATLLSQPNLPASAAITASQATSLALFTLIDILVFFAVLLVGFAYLWKRGDLDWVRAVTKESRKAAVHPKPVAVPAPQLASTAH